MTHKSYFDDLILLVKEATSTHAQVAIFLEAGHFDPRYGTTDFSKTSLEDALQFTKILIKEFGKKVKIVLGILIDDLGLDCSDHSCNISFSQSVLFNKEKDSLPKELEELLASSSLVKRDRVLLSSEKTSKNRGLLKLKKLAKMKCQQEGEIQFVKGEQDNTKVYFTDEEQNAILLAEFSGSIWKAKCPTIMGQHYNDCFYKIYQRFTHVQKLIIIDWAERLDYSKVTAGSQATMKVFKEEALEDRDLEILNIFFCDPEGEIYEIKQYKNILSTVKS